MTAWISTAEVVAGRVHWRSHLHAGRLCGLSTVTPNPKLQPLRSGLKKSLIERRPANCTGWISRPKGLLFRLTSPGWACVPRLRCILACGLMQEIVLISGATSQDCRRLDWSEANSCAVCERRRPSSSGGVSTISSESSVSVSGSFQHHQRRSSRMLQKRLWQRRDLLVENLHGKGAD